jgi:beta-galactosidase
LILDGSLLLATGGDPSKDPNFDYDQGVFAKTGDFKFAKIGFDDSNWRKLNLPHDWAVELGLVHDDTLQSHDYNPLGRRYPETSMG